uniref:Uncharacterized protein n=1 Tax=Strombidium sp. TaxID=181122 RepID=A0A7T0M4L2_9SPIT|nr:hypothetical protein [Strombidium sp.]
MSMYGFFFFFKNLNLIFFNLTAIAYLFDYIIINLHLLGSFSFLLIEVTESFSALLLSFFIVLTAFNLVTNTFSQTTVIKNLWKKKKTKLNNNYFNYFNSKNKHFLIRF